MNDNRLYGKGGFYDEEAVKEVDEMAPNFLFAPSDFVPAILKSSEGVHGLGYHGIQHTSVLSEKYGTREAALKIEKKGKGISGQVCVLCIYRCFTILIFRSILLLLYYKFSVLQKQDGLYCSI